MKFRHILQTIFGILTYIQGVYSIRSKQTGSGGTFSARYCYAVWMRHIVMAHKNNLNTHPKIIAELGPGDSLGIGMMALLLGGERYYAFDVVEFANLRKNIEIVDELVSMLKKREDIPDETEFPKVTPYLNEYSFPDFIYSQEYLNTALSNERINNIKESILDPNVKQSMIQYKAPWNEENIILPDSIDIVLSQAVLEHVDDLENVYQTLYTWIKPNGYMSHNIDFKSHGYSETWDGHRAISDLRWKLLRGKRPYLLNREVFSTHINLILQSGFKVLCHKEVKLEPQIKRQNLNKNFINITDSDRYISSAFVQSIKTG